MHGLLQGQGLREVDRATVKALVRQQIALGKPLFAPWYRDEHDQAQAGYGSWEDHESQNGPRFGAQPLGRSF